MSKKSKQTKAINDCVAKIKNNNQIRCAGIAAIDKVQKGDLKIPAQSDIIIKKSNQVLCDHENMIICKNAIDCLTFNDSSDDSRKIFSQG